VARACVVRRAPLGARYVFLASDESRYISGEIIGVTGRSPLA
jgi:hypothetical protein